MTWLLVGMFGVAMQVLAGFPQYLFYTAIIAALYTTLRLLGDWNWRIALAFVGIYIGGALLASVQLLPAIQTTHETTRGLRLPFNFASMVAFPPENFATLLAPNIFGEMAKYWGRWYLWETSLFIGVSGLALAVYAAIRCDLRIKLPALVIILVSLLLALGVLHTIVSVSLCLGAGIRPFPQRLANLSFRRHCLSSFSPPPVLINYCEAKLLRRHLWPQSLPAQ